MTICIDIRNLAQKNYSGVGIYTIKLLDNLLKIDTKNQYKLFYNSKKFPLIKKYYPNVTYYDFRRSNKLMNLTMLLFNYPKIDKLVNGFDIFFAPNINFFAFSNDKKIKKIITFHDISFSVLKNFYSIKSILWHKIIGIKKIFKKFDQIITVSENTKTDIIKYFNVQENKVNPVYLGTESLSEIEDKIKVDSKNIIREEVNEIMETPYLLNINTIEPRKNIEGIISAFSDLKKEGKLNNFNLIIAGGKGWNSSYIYEMIEGSEFRNNIKILNYISEYEKEFLYKNARIFLFPSFYEGFGLPIIEVQKYGIPVITSNNSSLSEICGCNGILVNPYNINEIKFAIENLLNDKNLYEKYKKLGIENAKKFTWENCALETLKVFNKCF